MRSAVLVGATGFLAVATAENAVADFTGCVRDLQAYIIAAGVSQDVASRALDRVVPNEVVLRLSKSQPEFKLEAWDYFAFLIDEQRVLDGRRMMEAHSAELTAAETRFGVDRHVLAAVWGVESDYGQEPGDHFLPESLSNLICTGHRRKDMWRRELVAALKLVDRGDLALDELKGSWAGAFGQTQFMPTTYQSLAVDMDGDGRRDLVKSVADALGSTGNFLKRAGWRKDESWMIEVKVEGYEGPSGRNKRASLGRWSERGLTRADGSELAGETQAALLIPAGNRGPGFLVFRNFNAIYAYNQAELYALAIAHLADRLAGYPSLRTPWPTKDPGLSRVERLHLQQLLIEQGLYSGEADGKIGPITRAAISEAEKRFGLEATGRPGRRIYRTLQEASSTKPNRQDGKPIWSFFDQFFGRRRNLHADTPGLE